MVMRSTCVFVRALLSISEYNQPMSILMLLIPILLGLTLGVLINYLADVLPASRRLGRPGCVKCQAPFPWLDYLLLRRCTHCQQKRSVRVWIVLLAYPLFSAMIWIFPRPILPSYPLAILLLAFFGLVAIIDLEHRVVMHPVSLFGLVLGLGVGLYLRGDTSLQYGILSTLLGGIAGFGIMLVLYLLGMLYVRIMARKKGLPSDEVALGFGDVNLAGILGLMLGWPAIAACLFFAILGGGLISLIIIAIMLAMKKYQAFTAIPYAPFLLLAATYLLFS
jgi:leader peptidase (prepilin peptidase)/N-methyltransferase